MIRFLFAMISPYQFRCAGAVALAAILSAAGPAAARSDVDATSRPGGTWTPRATVALADLPPLAPDGLLDAWGGVPDKRVKAAGFFRTAKLDGRWWLVTPAGGRFLSRGVNSVNAAATEGSRAALAEKFGDRRNWQDQTLKLLKDNGFNTLGAWAESGFLQRDDAPIAQTVTWSFMASYGKKRGGTHQAPGHTGYPGDCPFLFDADFPKFCETYAARLAAHASDPRVLGNFSDNELPWSRKMLERYLALPATDPGNRAAAAWLKARRVSKKSISDADRAAFLGFAVDRYMTIVSAAVRKAAPHQLFLGPRVHGSAIRCPEVFAALGRHCDVISVNYYGAWTPEAALLEMWNRESGKPVMITEFYAKAADSGMANTGGAGWVVRNQADRGAFYQNFAISLLRSRVCVGWSWHRYADNDPTDSRLDASNRDSNKGIVTNRYEPFTELLEAMSGVNRRIYGLAAGIDSSRAGF